MKKQTFKSNNLKYILNVETFEREDLRFTKAAYRELAGHGLTTEDVLACLNEGRDFKRKRKKGVFEKCLKRKKNVLKVVVAESWDYTNKKMVWAVIHIGKIKKSD